MSEGLERVSLTIPPELLSELDAVADEAEYASRSEAFRDALREFLTAYRWREDLDGRQQGTVVILYDHDVSGVTDELLALQHDLHGTIIASQHVHLTEDLCLETLVVDGPASDLRELVGRIQSLRGIRQVKLAVVGDAGGEADADGKRGHVRRHEHGHDRGGDDRDAGHEHPGDHDSDDGDGGGPPGDHTHDDGRAGSDVAGVDE